MSELTRIEKWLHAKSGSKYKIPFWRTRRHWSGLLCAFSRWPDIRLYNKLLDRVSKYTLCKLNRHDWDLNYMGPGCASFSCIRCGLTKNVGNNRP